MSKLAVRWTIDLVVERPDEEPLAMSEVQERLDRIFNYLIDTDAITDDTSYSIVDYQDTVELHPSPPPGAQTREQTEQADAARAADGEAAAAGEDPADREQPHQP